MALPGRAEEPAVKPAVLPVVVLQPLVPAPSAREIAAVSGAIDAFFAVRVQVLPAQKLPARAWYAPRRRHRAEIVLEELEGLAPITSMSALKVVGLTAADISTTNGTIADWGVLGLGGIDRPACVLSSFRCKRNARSQAHARERLAKVVVHELGHTFGSEHCPVVGCLMQDAQGTVKTVDAERTFCEATRAFFASRRVPLVLSPALPWA